MVLTGVTFTLIYDFIFEEKSARENLPWVHAALRILARMQTGYPCTVVTEAIQTILRGINPAYVWDPTPCYSTNFHASGNNETRSYPSNRDNESSVSNVSNVLQNPSAQNYSLSSWQNNTPTTSYPLRSQPREPQLQPTDGHLNRGQHPYIFDEPPLPQTASSSSSSYISSHPQGVPLPNGVFPEAAPPSDIFDSANLFQNALPINADAELMDITLADTGWDFATMDLETSLDLL